MTKKSEQGVNLKDNAPDGVAITDAEAKAARHEGAIEAAKEAGKDAYKYLTDGNLPGDPPANQWLGSDEIMQFEHLLGLGVEAFEDAVKEDAEPPIADEKVYGLLKLERNGQNRTPYVKALMKRLGLKKEDLPAGGPDYTNDVTPTSKL